jgi:hypothetical protein
MKIEKFWVNKNVFFCKKSNIILNLKFLRANQLLKLNYTRTVNQRSKQSQHNKKRCSLKSTSLRNAKLNKIIITQFDNLIFLFKFLLLFIIIKYYECKIIITLFRWLIIIIIVYYIDYSNWRTKNKFSQKPFWWSHKYFAYMSIIIEQTYWQNLRVESPTIMVF